MEDPEIVYVVNLTRLIADWTTMKVDRINDQRMIGTRIWWIERIGQLELVSILTI